MGCLFTQMPNLCTIYSLFSGASASPVFLPPQPTYPDSSFYLMGSTVTIIVNCSWSSKSSSVISRDSCHNAWKQWVPKIFVPLLCGISVAAPVAHSEHCRSEYWSEIINVLWNSLSSYKGISHILQCLWFMAEI